MGVGGGIQVGRDTHMREAEPGSSATRAEKLAWVRHADHFVREIEATDPAPPHQATALEQQEERATSWGFLVEVNSMIEFGIHAQAQ